jgi:hypothetical protein
MNRKDALKRLNGLSRQVEEHLEKIRTDRANDAYLHWVGEIESWLLQMESVVSHLGKKTGNEWADKIDEWKRELEN